MPRTALQTLSSLTGWQSNPLPASSDGVSHLPFVSGGLKEKDLLSYILFRNNESVCSVMARVREELSRHEAARGGRVPVRRLVHNLFYLEVLSYANIDVVGPPTTDS